MHPRLQFWRLMLAGLAVAAAVAPVHGAEISKEYQLKAAFLYNFTRFIEWPAGRFPAANSPIVIGVYRENPFGEELERVVAGRSVAGRPIEVREVATLEAALTTHLLFVPAGQEELLADHRQAFDGAGVVTVGESERFATLGGVIRFVVQGDRLRFAIRDVSDEATGLRISSQLLKLATAVHK
ncbi:MAG TPA: YfiR family protein [Opitutaceae bacterium]|nr:YfiR family protein [Opitutaceae bacterium]